MSAPPRSSESSRPAGRRGDDGRPSTDDLRQAVGTLLDSQRLGAVVLVVLLVLALFYTLYLGRVFFLPLTVAFLLSLLLTPLVRGLTKLKLPRSLGALLVLAAVVGGLGYGFTMVAQPAAERLEQLSDDLRRVEAKLRGLKRPVERVTEATQEVEELAQVPEDSGRQQVELAEPGLLETLFSNASELAAMAVVVLVLLYFLLASGDLFLQKLVLVLPTFSARKQAVRIMRRLEGDVSRYLLTITVINLVLGAAVGVAMWLLKMPNPVLWGVLAAVLNYVPYLGALSGVIIIAFVAILNIEPLWQAALPPLIYFALTGLEGYFITPMVLGRRLTLNAVVILVGLIFWTWLWGIPGALLAVPILVTLSAVCDHVPVLAPVGEFLKR